MEEIQIGGQSFFVKGQPPAPVRAQPATHECVCLLVKEPKVTDPKVIEILREVAGQTGIESMVESMIGDHDKCHQTVDNPDQPFCDDCENADHHLLPNQMGGARNIHRGNKEID